MVESKPISIAVDVVSDVVCPWCFIGKRRLEAAIERVAKDGAAVNVAVRWHPFELNPDLPPEGMDRRAYLDAKFGGSGRAAHIYERVSAAGESVGISFAFDRILRQPNTRDAHRVITWAQRRGDANRLVERLFAAYFLEGRNPGERAELTAIAGEAGLDATEVATLLNSRAGSDDVVASERRAAEIGIGGVPFFIFNERVAVSGAQDPRVLADAIAESLNVPAVR